MKGMTKPDGICFHGARVEFEEDDSVFVTVLGVKELVDVTI